MTREEFINWFEERFALTKNDIYEFGQLYDEVTKPHWISVEDELPKIGKDVLVLREDGEMQVVHQYNEKIARWWSVDGFPLKNNITHWMPLPEVPHHFADVSQKVKKGGKDDIQP
jgi:hypothetical protein